MSTLTDSQRSTRLPRRRGERGQAIILVVGVMTVIFIIAAIVIDFGLWLSERRGVQRVADLAAAAGAQDLLLAERDAATNDSAAIASALAWARDNGYEDGVAVELLCGNALTAGTAGVCSNTGQPGFSACQIGDGCDSLRVTVDTSGAHLFTSIFDLGGVETTIGASAVGGLTVDSAVLDTVILLDATGSMAEPPCNATQTNAGCPIKEARDAANSIVDVLAGGASGVSKVAYAPYNHCYNPPRSHPSCVTGANVVGLTTSRATLHAAVNSTTVVSSGAQTNICVALLRAQQLISGPGSRSGARRSIVLLADGDNNYSRTAYDPAIGYPPAACRPSNPTFDIAIYSGCRPAWTQEMELDTKTWQVATQLKNNGVEIYVVGFGVCGSDSGQQASASYCAGIGNTAHDDIADRRLLKCVASSPDHYFEEASASQLTATFQAIAWEIASRGLLQ